MIQSPHFESNLHNLHLPELVTDSISLNAQISWLASAPLQYPVIIEEAPTMPAPSHTPPLYQQFVEDLRASLIRWQVLISSLWMGHTCLLL